ncbi:MAG: hypothetical protein GC200_02750 [Tepidisphaera sp.]|nr:hypothetical protein [Tepidisphaera sp.]
MESLTIAEHIEHLTNEYRILVSRMENPTDGLQLRASLVRDAEWTDMGAGAVVMLAKQYGAFVLANALALAEALGLEDGETRI